MSGIEQWAKDIAATTRSKDEFRTLVEEYWAEVISETRKGVEAFNSVAGNSTAFKISLEPDSMCEDVWELSQGKRVVVAQLPVNESMISFGEVDGQQETTAEDLQNRLPIRSAPGGGVAAFDKTGECTPEDVARRLLQTLLHV
jgi:hypothetical protein